MSNENKENLQKQKPKRSWQNQLLRELQQKLDKLSESHGSLLEQNQRIEQKLEDLKSLLENRPDIITSQVDEPSDKQYEDRLVFNRPHSRKVLSDALENVQERLILVCPWLTSWATAVVIEKCEELIKRGVRIDIGWGTLKDLARDQIDPFWYGALPTLHELQNKDPGYLNLLNLKKLGTHEKFLVCDNNFAMLGSHNFLTSKESSPEFEVGILIKDTNTIQKLINRFDESTFDKSAALDYLSREGDTYDLEYDLEEQPIEIEVLKKIIEKAEKRVAENKQKTVVKLPPPQTPPVTTLREEPIVLLTKSEKSADFTTNNSTPPPLKLNSNRRTRKRTIQSEVGNDLGVTSTASSDKKPDFPVYNKPKEEAVKPPIITPSGGLGEIIVQLNWSQGTGEDGSKTAIDLDLGCLYELKDGQKGCIQALNEFFGDFFTTPYIHLGEDDRKGDKGEILRINGDKVAEFNQILVYAWIYKGIAKWSEANGVVKIKLPEVIAQEDIEVKLENPNDGITIRAIALFQNVGDNNPFKVTKIEEYFRYHPEMDKAFNWGLEWVEGSKD
ncbi:MULTISPECIES: phospholipase D-like domain-containing protein [unclassified Microcoleus]|uniref:phospholipase D-like domain-containing protein n=1 Tax=unclassified Microcoleus TaxID=2642155 RepID=UPI0025E5D6A8|nr:MULTISPECIES: phospholipase D-like domain-containing protein [unclassified Microcoleus]